MLGTDLREWLSVTNLKIEIYDCPNCGEQYPTIIPVLIQSYVGLASEVHACGESYTAVVLEPWESMGEDLFSCVKRRHGHELH